MFGYDRGDVLGQPIEFLLPERYRIAHRTHRSRYNDEPSVRFMGSGLDLWARRSDGSEFPVEISLSPTKANGKGTEVIASVRDISNRSDVEARLREAQVRFRGAFDDGPIPMALVEITPPKDRVILEANQAMARLLGYPISTLVGMSFADLTHPDDRATDDAAVPLIAAGELAQYSPVKRYLHADGSSIWVQLHASPLVRRDGSILGVAHVTDVTAQLEALAATERRQALDHAVSVVRLAMLGGATAERGLSLICQEAADCLQAQSVLVLTPQIDPELLGVAASFNVEEAVVEAMHFRASEGLVGEVFRSGQIQACGSDDPGFFSITAPVPSGVANETIVVAPMHNDTSIVGVLVITRRAGQVQLTEQDLEPIQAFASEAVVAIELATVGAAHQRLELLEDRERIGRDMHDKVIGRLFGTGMSLQATAGRADGELRDRVLAAVDEIDKTIKEIRSAIYGVRGQLDWGKGLRCEILAVAADATERLGFEPDVDLDGTIDTMGRELAEELMATLSEALTNAAKYAEATRVQISVQATSSHVMLVVKDNGVGPDAHASADPSQMHGHGLKNMAARAESLGGTAAFGSDGGSGSLLRWSVPRRQ